MSADDATTAATANTADTASAMNANTTAATASGGGARNLTDVLDRLLQGANSTSTPASSSAATATTTLGSTTSTGTNIVYESSDVGFGPFASSGLPYSTQIMILALLIMVGAMLLVSLCFRWLRRRQQQALVETVKKIVAARCDRDQFETNPEKNPVAYPQIPTWKMSRMKDTVDSTYMRILATHGVVDDDDDVHKGGSDDEGEDDAVSIYHFLSGKHVPGRTAKQGQSSSGTKKKKKNKGKKKRRRKRKKKLKKLKNEAFTATTAIHYNDGFGTRRSALQRHLAHDQPVTCVLPASSHDTLYSPVLVEHASSMGSRYGSNASSLSVHHSIRSQPLSRASSAVPAAVSGSMHPSSSRARLLAGDADARSQDTLRAAPSSRAASSMGAEEPLSSMFAPLSVSRPGSAAPPLLTDAHATPLSSRIQMLLGGGFLDAQQGAHGGAHTLHLPASGSDASSMSSSCVSSDRYRHGHGVPQLSKRVHVLINSDDEYAFDNGRCSSPSNSGRSTAGSARRSSAGTRTGEAQRLQRYERVWRERRQHNQQQEQHQKRAYYSHGHDSLSRMVASPPFHLHTPPPPPSSSSSASPAIRAVAATTGRSHRVPMRRHNTKETATRSAGSRFRLSALQQQYQHRHHHGRSPRQSSLGRQHSFRYNDDDDDDDDDDDGGAVLDVDDDVPWDVDELIQGVDAQSTDTMRSGAKSGTGGGLKAFANAVRSLRRKPDTEWAKQLEFDQFE